MKTTLKKLLSVLLVCVAFCTAAIIPAQGADENSSDPLIKCICDTCCKAGDFGDEPVQEDEITIYYRIPVEHGIITLYEYEDMVIEEWSLFHRMRRFTMFNYGYPEPMFYITDENRLISLFEAYKNYYVSDDEMEQLAKNGQAYLYFAGDVNFDKKVNIKDVTQIQRILVDLDYNLTACRVGDLDENWRLDIDDATRLQRYLVGFDDSQLSEYIYI